MNARRVAWSVLRDVHVNDAYANLVTPTALREARLSRSDAGFVTELVYGTLRMQGLYDAVVAVAAGRGIAEIDEDVLDLLRLGAHQWLYLHTPAHATVSETVNLAKSVQLGRSAGFVNAVMRRITERDRAEWIERVAPPTLAPSERLAISYSHPVWIVDEFIHALGERGRAGEIEELLGADNTAPTVSLVDLRMARDPDGNDAIGDAFVDSLEPDERTPFSLNLTSGDPGEIVRESGGLIRVQDVGSQLAALALWGARKAQEGEHWLDLCAGPGGKAALLAALAERSHAHLVANEVSPHRAKLVAQAVSSFSDVSVTVGDGRSFLSSSERFDRVLVDAPCSGLGALRRRPEARWRRTMADVTDLIRLQEELLAAACHVVAPGGLLAYVTCTPTVSETTGILSSVMSGRSDFRPVPVAPIISSVTNGAMMIDGAQPYVQLWPHVDNTDAMFISIFERTAN